MMKRRFIHNEYGGLTLEAALVFPFMILFVMTMISFIRIQSAHMALQSAVSETTKLVSVHMYPVKEMVDAGMETKAGRWVKTIQTAREQLETLDDFSEQYVGLLPDPLGELLQVFSEEVVSGIDHKGDELKNQAMQPIFHTLADHFDLDTTRLKVEKVILPSLDDAGDAYFGIEASYRVKLFIPFYDKEVTIRNKAKERVWIGES